METIKIGEIAQIRAGIPAYKQIDDGEKVIYYQMYNYNADTNKFENGTNAIITSKQAEKHLLCDNDVLLTAKGARYYCAVYHPEQKEEKIAIACSALFIIRATDVRISPQYLSWFLNRPEIGEKLKHWAPDYFIVRKDEIASLEIPLISLEKQYLIYEAFALLIEKRRIQKELSEAWQLYLFQSIYK